MGAGILIVRDHGEGGWRAMHERIVVNEVCFPSSMPLEAEIANWRRAGINRVGLANFKVPGGDWNASVQALSEAGVAVGYLLHASMYQLDRPETWDAANEAITATVDAAVRFGAPIVYTTTGPRNGVGFEEAVEAFVRASAPAVQYAERKQVRLLVETANPQFAHLHFLHNLSDTAEVAARAGLGLCLDLHAIWTERLLRRNIERWIDRVGLVQVSDWVPGTETVYRDPPGDGDIPLEQILSWLLDAGYEGPFDLEIYGQPADRALDGTARGMSWLDAALTRLGA